MEERHGLNGERPLTVLVTGSREGFPRYRMVEEISKFPPGTRFVNGGGRGVDVLCTEICAALGLPVESYVARWSLFGRAAGPRRNIEMIETARPDIVLAFHEDYEASKGTKQCVEYAKEKGTPVRLFRR